MGDDRYQLHLGDCLDVLKGMAENSVDSVVTDPPYGLSDHGEAEVVACLQAWMAGEVYTTKGNGFMGKSWDSWVPGPEVWRECFRVLKPGGYLIVFASTRTDDLMSMACRLAGFRKHPAGVWVFGSGFPKATNLSKAFDAGSGRPEDIRRAAMGDEYAPSGRGRVNYDHGAASVMNGNAAAHEPATPAAKQWDGWFYGLQSLKPAMEPWLMFQKPHEVCMTDNVLKWGTGAVNVDACRVDSTDNVRFERAPGDVSRKNWRKGTCVGAAIPTDIGRWPANLLHDGSDAVVTMFPTTAGASAPVKGTEASNASDGNITGERARVPGAFHSDSGSAARFFNTFPPEEHDPLHYCPKASKADREEGLAGFSPSYSLRDNGFSDKISDTKNPRANNHPTVKPTALMRHLVRLITPPGGTCLDPFLGSGSTGKAAMLEGFNFIGIEREAEYVAIAEARIAHAAAKAGDPAETRVAKALATRSTSDTEEAFEAAQGALF